MNFATQLLQILHRQMKMQCLGCNLEAGDSQFAKFCGSAGVIILDSRRMMLQSMMIAFRFSVQTVQSPWGCLGCSLMLVFLPSSAVMMSSIIVLRSTIVVVLSSVIVFLCVDD